MKNHIKKLNNKNWEMSADPIYALLKDEMLGEKGFIKSVRQKYEKTRQKNLDELKEKFIKDKKLKNLDDRLNEYTKKIESINLLPNRKIYYDFANIIKEDQTLSKNYPNCSVVGKEMISGTFLNNLGRSRLGLIVGRILTESVSQSKKANAGLAGEDFMERICDIIGLIKGTHYKTQHKSESGSDTDFVFPYVDDYKDIDVDIFVAVQFSSNDRLRLATSELKEGGKRYLVTGNGFDASSLDLNKIGDQLISDAKSKKYILVCYLPEIKKQKKKLEENIKKGFKKDESKKSLEFFKENTITFSEFAQRLKKRL